MHLEKLIERLTIEKEKLDNAIDILRRIGDEEGKQVTRKKIVRHIKANRKRSYNGTHWLQTLVGKKRMSRLQKERYAKLRSVK